MYIMTPNRGVYSTGHMIVYVTTRSLTHLILASGLSSTLYD